MNTLQIQPGHPMYPPSTRALYSPVKIPYLPHQPYDNGDFSEFPSRIGWDKREFISGELKTGGPQHAAAFLQTWLFFGLMSSVLGLPPNAHTTLIKTDPQTRSQIVCNDTLQEIIQRWTDETSRLDSTRAWERIKHAKNCLDEASVFSLAMDVSAGPGFRLDNVAPEVRFSLMDLGDQLANAIEYLYREMHEKFQIFQSAGILQTNNFGNTTNYQSQQQNTSRGQQNSGQQLSWVQLSRLGAGREYFQQDDGYHTSLYDNLQLPWDPWRWGTSNLLRSRMLNAWWCPYEAERVQDILSPWAVHFASALRYSNRPDHSSCTTVQCNGNTIDENTYQTKHIYPTCDCEFMGLPQQDVLRVLQAGRFPVVEVFMDNKTRDVTLSIIDNQSETFTAISHVWAHGLGNARENKLPKCRLIWLLRDLFSSGREAARDIRTELGGVLRARIWIDTLCVPLQPPEARRVAISRLSEVYGTCRTVFVLDTAFMYQNLCDMTETEALIRMYCSTWMQRIWTFQEGASAVALTAIFAELDLDIRYVSRRDRASRKRLPIARNGNYFDILEQMLYSSHALAFHVQQQSSKSESPHEEHECERIATIWNGLAWRISTKTIDQPLILAAMAFGRYIPFELRKQHEQAHHHDPMDAHDAMNKLNNVQLASKEARWVAFYQGFRYFPQGILFVDCETLNYDGYRWAPYSIGTLNRAITDPKPGAITPKGLVVRRPGYLLQSLEIPLKPKFELLDEATATWYEITLMRQGDNFDWPTTIGQGYNWSYILVQGSREVGYSKVPAVLGAIREHGHDGTLYIVLEKKVYMSRVFRERKVELDSWVLSYPNSTRGEYLVRGTKYHENQVWCVG